MPDSIFLLHDLDLAEEMLRVLDDGGFKAIRSLEKIVVISGVYDINEDVIALRENPCEVTGSTLHLPKRLVPKSIPSGTVTTSAAFHVEINSSLVKLAQSTSWRFETYPCSPCMSAAEAMCQPHWLALSWWGA